MWPNGHIPAYTPKCTHCKKGIFDRMLNVFPRKLCKSRAWNIRGPQMQVGITCCFVV